MMADIELRNLGKNIADTRLPRPTRIKTYQASARRRSFASVLFRLRVDISFPRFHDSTGVRPRYGNIQGLNLPADD